MLGVFYFGIVTLEYRLAMTRENFYLNFLTNRAVCVKIEIISNILKFMIILLGSESGQKKEILRGVLDSLLETDFEVVVCRADSGITEQPLDLETTM